MVKEQGHNLQIGNADLVSKETKVTHTALEGVDENSAQGFFKILGDQVKLFFKPVGAQLNEGGDNHSLT